MKLMDRAALYSRAAHQAVGQQRKYTGEPYWHHPAAVAELVVQVAGVSEEMIAAAYLHDVVEDTSVTHDDIMFEFGVVISGYVLELTDHYVDPELGNRAHRKALERERLARISSQAQTIKYADLIDNTRSIVDRDPGFAKIYMAEKQALLGGMQAGDAGLYAQARALVDDFYR
ncbi:HD domain-containing protein [Halomonas binhaiensis]|uniref:HD domain-containing protein n=1 Tax=Halomonas binhaiensis TaxID=2562282 RepID=A0A5C1NEJ9_9GAMM|nr:HD domain-containing protein [Halomonas binhaiensis]QEM81684.1 HD domain-containing protein [Halomonas binhaiensis]